MLIPNHYEINISLDGQHYVQVKITDGAMPDRAKGIAHMFRLKFREVEGYKVTLSHIECTGREVSF